MKTLVAAVALAAVIIAPAFAQNVRRDRAPPRAEIAPYASQYQAGPTRRHSTSNDVYDINGRYIGSDPSATVRSNLEHDPPWSAGD